MLLHVTEQSSALNLIFLSMLRNEVPHAAPHTQPLGAHEEKGVALVRRMYHTIETKAEEDEEGGSTCLCSPATVLWCLCSCTQSRLRPFRSVRSGRTHTFWLHAGGPGRRFLTHAAEELPLPFFLFPDSMQQTSQGSRASAMCHRNVQHLHTQASTRLRELHRRFDEPITKVRSRATRGGDSMSTQQGGSRGRAPLTNTRSCPTPSKYSLCDARLQQRLL
ncbi:uncharacterized protein EI97DRAFT_78321 [Westerdykella ornata]|uniref:Uncharacterized protein n=1 Tax=Westerdykella ornata TaxID=318751 RepID=A0A6A6JFE1_WESOR|nr:uncharacterized protein EI97DRAFT_78321 [Westerdykella ornata]KAF2275132.1 hypothetical protein EI97DRAFT_78321 [Westerdykella ornata]